MLTAVHTYMCNLYDFYCLEILMTFAVCFLHTRWRCFPPSISTLSLSLLSPCSLRLVDATENELSLLPPPRAWKSCGLKDLRLNGNRLSHLDLDKCDKFWPQLESLYVGQNNLREVSVPDVYTAVVVL